MPLIASRPLALAVLLACGCRGGDRSQSAPDAAPSAMTTSTASIDAAPPPPTSPPPDPPPPRSEPSRCAAVQPETPLRLAEAFASARHLRSAAERDALMLLGKEGKPKRIALRVHGTFGAGCDCPPFGASFTAPGNDEESGFDLLAVERPGTKSASIQRTTLEFILVGYFSGANIDTYEWFRARGVEPATPDEEQRSTWLEVHPELCVEAWCWAPPRRSQPSAPASEYERFIDSVSAGDAAEMAKRGIPRCDAKWMKEPAP